METQTLIEKIIDNARWAPSGDNAQPWRFQIINDKQFVIHGYDTRDHCVYDLQGHASQLAIGVLMESITIAASAFSHRTEFKSRTEVPENNPTIDVFLIDDPDTIPDPLFPFLPIRSVQRRMLKVTPLTLEHKQKLEQSIGNFYTIKWMENFSQRWQMAWLMFKNAKLRLTMPEAYLTHKSVIEWNARFSDDKIPDEAIGLDPMATKLMRWTMENWGRVHFFNTYLLGTLLPRIQLDLIPGIFCASHFAIVANERPKGIDDFLQAGRAVQRFWLTATQLGIQLQPEMTPLIFSEYIREDVNFTSNQMLKDYARDLAKKLIFILDTSDNVTKTCFLGRLGFGEEATARSLRLSKKVLLSPK